MHNRMGRTVVWLMAQSANWLDKIKEPLSGSHCNGMHKLTELNSAVSNMEGSLVSLAAYIWIINSLE